MPAPATWLLLLGLVGLALALNAWRPLRRPSPAALASFIAGWLTAELAPVHLLVQAGVAALLVARGALAAPSGWVGVGLLGAGWVLLARHHRLAAAAEATVEAALVAGLGGAYRGALRPEVALPLRKVTRQRNVVYHEEARLRLRLDVYRAAGPETQPRPAFLFVHGGGWVMGNKDTQGLPLLFHLAARGWVGLNVNYRLARRAGPRSAIDEALADVKRAVAWTRAHAAELGVDPRLVVVGGNSAGGHLAALAALDPDTAVAGCVSLYGVYDLLDRHGHWPHGGLRLILERFVLKRARAADPDAFDRASPLSRVHAAAPPFFIVHGASDSLVPVAEAHRFRDALAAVSANPVCFAEIAGAQHAFDVFPSRRTAHVVRGIGRFVGWLRVRPAMARVA